MQDVSAADRVPGDLGDHRLRESPDLDLEVEDVESTDTLSSDVVITYIPCLLYTSLDVTNGHR